MQVAVRATRIGEVLLADEQEGALRHRAAVDRPLGDRDLLERPRDVDCPGAAAGLVGPRHPSLNRQVDLECSRPVAVAPVGAGDPRRQPLPRDLGDGSGSEIEDDEVGIIELGERGHPPPGLDLPARAREGPMQAHR